MLATVKIHDQSFIAIYHYDFLYLLFGSIKSKLQELIATSKLVHRTHATSFLYCQGQEVEVGYGRGFNLCDDITLS